MFIFTKNQNISTEHITILEISTKAIVFVLVSSEVQI